MDFRVYASSQEISLTRLFGAQRDLRRKRASRDMQGAGMKKPRSLAETAAAVGLRQAYLNRSLTRSVQLLALGEWRSPPFFSDSSSSLSSFFWCSVSLTGVSTAMWQ